MCGGKDVVRMQAAEYAVSGRAVTGGLSGSTQLRRVK